MAKRRDGGPGALILLASLERFLDERFGASLSAMFWMAHEVSGDRERTGHAPVLFPGASRVSHVAFPRRKAAIPTPSTRSLGVP